jgi:hypothetical protein
MNSNHLANDCWIVSQLTGIRMLEKQISDALVSGKRRQNGTLRLQVARLKSWVSQVDHALSVRAQEGSGQAA